MFWEYTENFRSTLMPKCDFNKVASGNGYCSVSERFPFPDIIILSLLWVAVIIDAAEPATIENKDKWI